MGEVIIRIGLEKWMAYFSLILLLIYTIAAVIGTVLKYKLLKLRRTNQ